MFLIYLHVFITLQNYISSIHENQSPGVSAQAII